MRSPGMAGFAERLILETIVTVEIERKSFFSINLPQNPKQYLRFLVDAEENFELDGSLCWQPQ